MSETQKKVSSSYFQLLQTQALATAWKVAKRTGILQALFDGQKDLDTIVTVCGLVQEPTERCLSVLVAAGVVEKYGEDYALSQLCRLMMGAESRFDHEVFDHAEAYMGQGKHAESRHFYRQRLIDRMWTHTSAAMQASKGLDIGGNRKGLNALELGSGAGVWSAAMAYRDPTMRVTLVDDEKNLRIAKETFASIDLNERATHIEGDYRQWDVPLASYDMVLLPENLQLENDADAVVLLGRSWDALKEGGELVILEPLLEVDGPTLSIRAQSFELAIACGGTIRSVSLIQRLLTGAGFGDAQWGWLTTDHQGLGVIVAKK